MTTLAHARKMHREENRKRTTVSKTIINKDGDEETVSRKKWGEKRKNYTPFRAWARQNEDKFQTPYSPKLKSILS